MIRSEGSRASGNRGSQRRIFKNPQTWSLENSDAGIGLQNFATNPIANVLVTSAAYVREPLKEIIDGVDGIFVVLISTSVCDKLTIMPFLKIPAGSLKLQFLLVGSTLVTPGPAAIETLCLIPRLSAISASLVPN